MGRPTWHRNTKICRFSSLTEEATEGGETKLNKRRVLRGRGRITYFFMSLLTFVKLSKQKFMPFICMH